MTLIRNMIIAVVLVFPVAAVMAADDRPPPPQDVFHYVVNDAGGALEIDWAVKDGAYMYRDEFRFAVDDAAVVLGEAELPEGEVHNDEFFGEQVVYRGSFFVRIPYTLLGDKPASVALTIDSRGCLDSGYCYMPQTWTESVKLRSAATGKSLNLANIGGNSMDEALPADQVFIPDAFAVDGNTIG
ncbi:MAG: protein-disulfide reductase DsbD N-terminal domain-containing protein, partial [Gammaproteobacteria bacterium]|nr:protein-disulfide reductase DsbD N-terminal domain-containing protein [Gammaproteobacteria bacterium]